ncbi:MAG: hypothetical protein GTN99_11375 [Candidatus Dadabacteria bacterium]|nr:hypothetical protein [Candidatus Dadabacteria bacterium]NIT14801.1 hypothetical protein [Candidatus Dadabacteria bacterium]
MTNKKKVLGVDPLSWIKQTKEDLNDDDFLEKKEYKKTATPLPKYETYEVKLTLRLNDDHLDYLTKLEREIMKNRSPKNKKERITKNSILRAMIESFKEVDFKKDEISDELELKKRLIKQIKNDPIKPF